MIFKQEINRHCHFKCISISVHLAVESMQFFKSLVPSRQRKSARNESDLSAVSWILHSVFYSWYSHPGTVCNCEARSFLVNNRHWKIKEIWQSPYSCSIVYSFFYPLWSLVENVFNISNLPNTNARQQTVSSSLSLSSTILFLTKEWSPDYISLAGPTTISEKGVITLLTYRIRIIII